LNIKPFAVPNDFAKKGIATLRLDDRGIEVHPKVQNDTSANFATDIEAASFFSK
jgi:hypothetical protein